MRELTGKVALVTGGSRGIGAAVSKRLAAEGASVALTYHRDAEGAEKIAKEIAAEGGHAVTVHADSADPAAVRAAVDHTAEVFGGLDILVNNAGVLPWGPLEAVTTEELDRAMAVNARGPFLAAQAASAYMGPGGRIISIGTCVTERVSSSGMTLYAMSKAALTGMTKGLARDLGGRGITAVLVQPGPTDTEMNPAGGPGGELQARMTAVGRYGTPEEIATTVVHLAGEGGRFITGTAIAVDGGFMI
ncbi:SDR family NAD(P)-dependent oxidoreductase [Streptomyces sp. NBC_00557]|uniref:SDR family NAD(P)-dependent oxidoreductase n=1 Tax=Streptomyces sp. NBC_00557 TaxID=2975776 RepID=UPI002E824955|nr:SDR family oxidoreductase [Streptomyces sp. NBC_00557]WUC40222.1 SDR family oxidoreductase [Streptomyces sp. NBC_00557]